MPDPMQHAIQHSSSPSTTTTSKILPVAFHVSRLEPEQTYLERVGETCSRHGERPANVRELFQALQQEWVAIPAQVIYNLIQSMSERCWAVIDSQGGYTLADVRVTESQNTECLNFSLDEKSVKIMKIDLNHLQYEIWWTYNVVEFSSDNSILKQTEIRFFFWTVYNLHTETKNERQRNSWITVVFQNCFRY